MKPMKIVEHRQQSVPARCGRELERFTDIDGSPKAWLCVAPLQLVVTRNPIGALPYDELIVTRCMAGHLSDSQGVVAGAEEYEL